MIVPWRRSTVRALFRGPSHVIVVAEAELVRLAGVEIIGRPAREVFIAPAHRATQLLMDRVFRTGVPVRVEVPSDEMVAGVLFIEPVHHCDRVWGLVTEWLPLAVPVPTPDDRGRAPALR